MIDIKALANAAADQFALSLTDDPTAWPDELKDIKKIDVHDRIFLERLTCGQSAMRTVLGQEAQTIATAMDVAIYSDGALADLVSIICHHVTGLTAFSLTPVAEAKNWQDRLDRLREAFAHVVSLYRPAELTDRQVLEYLSIDPRFDDCAALKAQFQPVQRESRTQVAEPELEPRPVKTPKPFDPANRRFAPSRVPEFAAMLSASGLIKADIARLTGLSVSYMSYVFNGKKPWPGLRVNQQEAIRAEITTRRDAINRMLEIIDTGDLLIPAETWS